MERESTISKVSIVKAKIDTLLRKLGTTGFFHVFGSSVINKIIAFASSIVLVRILTKGEYGIYSYADNIIKLFTLASGLGVTSGVLQMCSEVSDEDERSKLYSVGCRIGFYSNLVLAIVIVIVALFVPLPIKGANKLLLVMCLIPFTALLSDLQRTYLRTQLRNKEFSYANTFNTILTFIGACVLAWLFRTYGLVAAYYIAAMSTFFLIIIRWDVPFSIRKKTVDRDKIKQMVNISVISMMNNGLTHLMYLLDVFVLGICVRQEAVIASYKIATLIPSALAFIPTSIIIYVYPYFARNRMNKTWVKRNYARLTVYVGALNFLIAAGLIAFAPLVIRIFFGAQYLDALVPFRILSASFAISGTFRIITGNLLVTQRKLKFNLFTGVLSGIINTTLNVVMINKWGAVGAALATIITVVIISVLNVWYLLRTFNAIPESNQ